MTPWSSAATYECAAAQSMDPWSAIQKASQERGGDSSSCPGPYLTAACPEFHIGCRLGRELSTCPYAAPDAHGAIGCDQKCFILLVVWRWHQFLFDSLSKSRLSRVSLRLGRKLFRLTWYHWIIVMIVIIFMIVINVFISVIRVMIIWWVMMLSCSSNSSRNGLSPLSPRSSQAPPSNWIIILNLS